MFGQYSANGGQALTKRDMVATFGLSADIKSRIAGKNRLHWTDADGAQHYSLHSTVIASLSADRRTLTLDDGGWATMTTRRAISEACQAFGLGYVSVFGARGGHIANGVSFDRKAVIRLPEWKLADGGVDCPMIRASDDEYRSQNLEVRYEDGRVISSGGVEFCASPFAVLKALYQIDRVIRSGHGKFTLSWHGQREPLSDLRVTILGFEVEPGGDGGRTVHIGCHAFKSRDVRAAMRRIEEEHPEAAKRAKASVRKSTRVLN